MPKGPFGRLKVIIAGAMAGLALRCRDGAISAAGIGVPHQISRATQLMAGILYYQFYKCRMVCPVYTVALNAAEMDAGILAARNFSRFG